MNRLQGELLPLVGRSSGLTLERTQYALALHYHSATPADSDRLVQQFQRIVTAHQQQGVPVEIVHGKQMIAVRPTGISKGRALRTLLSDVVSPQLLLYFGAEATDEEAFREVNNHGVAILVADPPHATAAPYYLPNPDAVIACVSEVIRLRQRQL